MAKDVEYNARSDLLLCGTMDIWIPSFNLMIEYQVCISRRKSGHRS
jgi:hypothetical protein